MGGVDIVAVVLAGCAGDEAGLAIELEAAGRAEGEARGASATGVTLELGGLGCGLY